MNDVVVMGAPDGPLIAAPSEGVTDAAVEIAEIQAERDVAITEIQAETAIELAETTGQDDEDMQWLRNELESLRVRCATLEGASSSLETQLVSLSAQVGEMASGLAILIASQTPPPPLAPEEIPVVEEPVVEEPVVEEPVVEEPTTALNGGEDGLRENPAPGNHAPAAEAPRIRRKWL